MEGALGAAPDGTTQDRIPVILTHEGVSGVWKQRAARGPATRDVEHRNRIAEHVERTLGTKIELFISERQPCHGLTVDVLVVPPTDERPFYVLVTRGLSEMYMNVHPLAKHSPSRIELVICLPKTWEVSLEAFRKSEQYFWPVRQLKRHALFPAIHNTYISLGHTVANELVNDDIPPSPDNPSRPFCSNTTMNSMLMMVPALLSEEFHIMTVKKPNKKKKKRARKRDKAESNGQREGAAAANNGAANGNGNARDGEKDANVAEKDGTGEKVGTDGQQNQQPQQPNGEIVSANGNGNVEGNAERQQLQEESKTKQRDAEGAEENTKENETEKEKEMEEEKERETNENGREGESAKLPENGEAEQQAPQDGEKKKGRRRRGGKKKNKKNANSGENRQGEEGAKKEGVDLHENGGAAETEKGNGKNETKQQQQRQRRNEEPFLYGENKEDVYFYQLLPLYQEEVDFKLKHGLDCLLERLEQLPPLDVMTITPGRRNVCQMPVKRKILKAKRSASPKSPGGTPQTPQEGVDVTAETSPSGAPAAREQEEQPEDGGGQDQQRSRQPDSPYRSRTEENNGVGQHPQQHEGAQQQQPEREEAKATEGADERSVGKVREDVGKVGTNGRGNEHK